MEINFWKRSMFENWPAQYAPKEWNHLRSGISMHKRNKTASLHANKITERNSDLQWKTEDIDRLNSHGFQFLDDLLTTKQCDEIYEYFIKSECYDFYNTHSKFNITEAPSGVRLGRHDIKTNLKCPYVVDLMTNEKIISMASEYLGAPATLSLMLPMWSFNNDIKIQNINMQLFHRDCDDSKNLKLFILLSDTAKNDGSQEYVLGSHSAEGLPNDMYKIARYSDKEVYKYFDKASVVNISGRRGLTWLADTYGIHKGTPPSIERPNRLLFQLQFTYNPVPIFNYKAYRYSKWDGMSDLVKYSTRKYLRR